MYSLFLTIFLVTLISSNLLYSKNTVHNTYRKKRVRKYPGDLVVRALCFHCRGKSLIPDWGTKIPQAFRCNQTKICVCVCVCV